MPINKNDYPKNWDEIAKKAKEKAGWKCEKCGVSHMEDGTNRTCLTVHHPNHDPGNPEAELIALCAKCHLIEEVKYKKYGDLSDQLIFMGLPE